MNEEEKKTYLQKYRLQQARIRRMNELLISNPDKRSYYMEQIDNSVALRNKIEDEIEAVDGSILTEILSQKYLCGKPIDEIAYALNYSRRQIERLHVKALEQIHIS